MYIIYIYIFKCIVYIKICKYKICINIYIYMRVYLYISLHLTKEVTLRVPERLEIMAISNTTYIR